MKNKDSADRTNPVSKKDQAEDFELAEVSGEELFVRDDDIIGFFEESPVMLVHTDETLENDESEDVQDEDAELLDIEMIMSSSDVEEPDTDMSYHEYPKDGEAAHLKIGDVLDPDAEMVVGSEDGDETISGFEGDFLDPDEDESDTSERIIVTEDMIPSPDSEPEPDIEEEPDILEEKVLEPYEDIAEEEMLAEEILGEESDDDVLELAEDSIIAPPAESPVVEKSVVAIIEEDQKDEESEKDETIELVELVEEIDKDSLEIRDIEDILGLGSEVLENTRELIVPIGFHQSEDYEIQTNLSESHSLSGSEKEHFEEDSTGGDLMNEVEKMLAAQEETQIVEPADEHHSDITPDTIRETMLLADMPDGDISAIIEKTLQEEKAAISNITPFEEEFDNKKDFEELIGNEEDFLTNIESEAENIGQALEINDKFFDLQEDKSPEQADEDEEVFDTDAATIIAPPNELTQAVSQTSQENYNLLDIDIDWDVPEDKSPEQAKPPQEDDTLLDIDIDSEVPADKSHEQTDEGEEIFDADAATIIAPAHEFSQVIQKTSQEDVNLLDIDIDSEVPADKSPEQAKLSQVDDDLLDIDEDLNIPAGDLSDEDEEILDADAATIIASPQELDEIKQPVRQENDLLDIDVEALDIDFEVQKLVQKASDDIEDFNLDIEDISDAETIIALPENIPTHPNTEIDILTDDDIFDLSPDTIISEPMSKDTTTQKFDSSSLQTSEQDIDDQDAQTVFLQPEDDDTESLRKIPDIKPSEQAIVSKTTPIVKKDGFAAEVLKELRLPVKKEPPVKIVEQFLEEPPADSDIVEGEIFEEEERELLKFLEMELTPIDFPEAKESDGEERGVDEDDEYVPIEEVMKNPQEGEGTVISEMIRSTSEVHETRPDSAIYLSITPEQMEAALERVIQKVFSEKIEHIVTQVIEKTFTEELEKKLRIILMQDDGSRR